MVIRTRGMFASFRSPNWHFLPKDPHQLPCQLRRSYQTQLPGAVVGGSRYSGLGPPAEGDGYLARSPGGLHVVCSMELVVQFHLGFQPTAAA